MCKCKSPPHAPRHIIIRQIRHDPIQAGKPVFIEDAEQQIILDTDYQTRVEEANRFFEEKDLSWSGKFLKDSRIRYVYLPKAYYLPMAEGEYPMTKIFENEDVNIYLVKP